jgi:hypothetical protein
MLKYEIERRAQSAECSGKQGEKVKLLHRASLKSYISAFSFPNFSFYVASSAREGEATSPGRSPVSNVGANSNARSS